MKARPLYRSVSSVSTVQFGPLASPYREVLMPSTKRTNRLEMPVQIRTDEELGNLIRARAESNIRTIQGEILWLIRKGIKAEEVELRQAASGDVRRTP